MLTAADWVGIFAATISVILTLVGWAIRSIQTTNATISNDLHSLDVMLRDYMRDVDTRIAKIEVRQEESSNNHASRLETLSTRIEEVAKRLHKAESHITALLVHSGLVTEAKNDSS